jgi:nucleoside-diphosphate-sugar epimerase
MATRSATTIAVTGGAGNVGSRLVPKLLDAGYQVRVLDLYLYGEEALAGVRGHRGLTEIKGDMRRREAVDELCQGADTMIHLACISNDPSFELDPNLGKSVNYDCFPDMIASAKAAGITRFIYASSSSVYGVKDELDVTEELSMEPLTDYSKFKMLCEGELNRAREPGFETLILRPATVCGYAPRQRLDVIVNILTNHAVCNRKIRVFGGAQVRPNIHIEDMTDLYLQCVSLPTALVDGKTFNAGYYNQRVDEIADTVRSVVGDDVRIDVEPSDDPRSYRINSDKIRREIGFVAKHPIEEAVEDIARALHDGRLPNSLSDPRYYNIKTMQLAGLR